MVIFNSYVKLPEGISVYDGSSYFIILVYTSYIILYWHFLMMQNHWLIMANMG